MCNSSSWELDQPDVTERSADSEEGGRNGDCSDIEEIHDTAPTSLSLHLIPETASDASNTDEDGGEEVGQLEIELKPGLTSGLSRVRQTNENCRVWGLL